MILDSLEIWWSWIDKLFWRLHVEWWHPILHQMAYPTHVGIHRRQLVRYGFLKQKILWIYFYWLLSLFHPRVTQNAQFLLYWLFLLELSDCFLRLVIDLSLPKNGYALPNRLCITILVAVLHEHFGAIDRFRTPEWGQAYPLIEFSLKFHNLILHLIVLLFDTQDVLLHLLNSFFILLYSHPLFWIRAMLHFNLVETSSFLWSLWYSWSSLHFSIRRRWRISSCIYCFLANC